MADTKEIESLVLDKFAFLQDGFGLGNPILDRDASHTTISYLSKEIGIEIELDWHDLDVFILITKLDEGKLPKGYYVYNGKVCRVHLEEMLHNKLNISRNEIQLVIGKNKKQNRSKQAMVIRINAYQQLLHNHFGAICSAGGNLFK